MEQRKTSITVIALETPRIASDPADSWINKCSKCGQIGSNRKSNGMVIEGNWDNIEQLGLGVIAAIDSRHKDLKIYTEVTVETLLSERFPARDLIIGYNVRAFEYPILKPYSRYDLQRLPTFDMFAELQMMMVKHKGLQRSPKVVKEQRISLQNVIKRTLGIQIEDYSESPWLWNTDKKDVVIEQLERKVKVLEDLFKHGCSQGEISYYDSSTHKVEILDASHWRYKARCIVESEVPEINFEPDTDVFKPAPAAMSKELNPSEGLSPFPRVKDLMRDEPTPNPVPDPKENENKVRKGVLKGTPLGRALSEEIPSYQYQEKKN